MCCQKRVLNNGSEEETEAEVTASETGPKSNQDVAGEAQVVVKKQKMEDGTPVPTAEWYEEAKRLARQNGIDNWILRSFS